MAHAKPRVPPLLDVARGAAEPANQEVAKPLLGPLQVVRRVHGAQEVVVWNLPVERRDKALEPVFTDGLEDLGVVHVCDVTSRAGTALTRPHQPNL